MLTEKWKIIVNFCSSNSVTCGQLLPQLPNYALIIIITACEVLLIIFKQHLIKFLVCFCAIKGYTARVGHQSNS